jgi:tRNA nucleotidyltransferase (CCA-adding enzyme)
LDDLAVDGDDLLRDAGAVAGPAVGRVLRQLLDWVVDDPRRNTRDALLARARTLLPGEET